MTSSRNAHIERVSNMPESQEHTQQIVTMTISDLIYAQIKDLGKRMDRIETRMDKLESRIEKLEEKLTFTSKDLNDRMNQQDAKIEKLSDKIDALRNDIRSSSNHGNIMTASVVSIALAVIYAVLK